MTTLLIPGVRPYHVDEKSGIVLYCGDCRELLPRIPKGTADLVLTDPPWGVDNCNENQTSGRGNRPYDRGTAARDFPPCAGDDSPFDPAPLLETKNLILWGANHYADRLPASSFWLVWDRKVGKAADCDATDCELAWTRGTSYRTVRKFSHMWVGFQRDSEVGQRHWHPMQKPAALMRWSLGWFPDCGVVFDPYCGSGTTLVAAKLEGRRAIGIEINPDYCAIARERLIKCPMGFTQRAKKQKPEKPRGFVS